MSDKKLTLNPKRIVLRVLGLLFSTVPVVAATLLYFPLWRERGGAAALSGGVLLLLILSAAPLFRFIREHLRSPSVTLLWLLIFLLFFALSNIAAEMTVIAFVGFIGNLIGSGLFLLARLEPRQAK